jgi:hypothetical protein
MNAFEEKLEKLIRELPKQHLGQAQLTPTPGGRDVSDYHEFGLTQFCNKCGVDGWAKRGVGGMFCPGPSDPAPVTLASTLPTTAKPPTSQLTATDQNQKALSPEGSEGVSGAPGGPRHGRSLASPLTCRHPEWAETPSGLLCTNCWAFRAGAAPIPHPSPEKYGRCPWDISPFSQGLLHSARMGGR